MEQTKNYVIKIKPYSLDETFNACAKLVSSLPEFGPISIGVSDKLKMYALYKIATGKQEERQTPPSYWSPVARLKWMKLQEYKKEGITEEKAKEMYIRSIGDLLKGIYVEGESERQIAESDLSFLFELTEPEMSAIISEIERNKNNEEDKEFVLLFYKLLEKHSKVHNVSLTFVR